MVIYLDGSRGDRPTLMLARGFRNDRGSLRLYHPGRLWVYGPLEMAPPQVAFFARPLCLIAPARTCRDGRQAISFQRFFPISPLTVIVFTGVPPPRPMNRLPWPAIECGPANTYSPHVTGGYERPPHPGSPPPPGWLEWQHRRIGAPNGAEIRLSPAFWPIFALGPSVAALFFFSLENLCVCNCGSPNPPGYTPARSLWVTPPLDVSPPGFLVFRILRMPFYDSECFPRGL